MPDFGYGSTSNQTTANSGASDTVTDLDTGKHDIAGTGDGNITDIDDNNNNGGNGTVDNNGGNKDGNKDTDSQDGDVELVEGSVIEVGDDSYTVDKDGNLVDKDGNIFKEAKDVQEFIKGFDVDNNDNTELSINTIKEHLGIDIVGEDGNPIEFDNTPEGVAAYIDSVIEQREDELAEAGVNRLIETYPIIQDVLNYYVANGNSLEGFGEVKDRSNITIDEKNIAQQEAIIRESFREFDRRGNVDEYIQYLKDKGILFATAQEELQGLIDADNAYKEQIAQEARQAAIQREQEETAYWTGVQETIKSRKIAGYEIPETIIINKDGKKIAATPNDFFNYVYQVDENGNSRYNNDLAAMTPEQRRDDSLLRAYLRFTGGSYADLVNLAIKDQEVKKLRLIAKDNSKRTARIVPPTSSKSKGGNTDFGY
jgi:hypothetical protein